MIAIRSTLEWLRLGRYINRVKHGGNEARIYVPDFVPNMKLL